MTDTIFAVAAALFVFSFFRMMMRLWQFRSYDQSFGKVPRVSMEELAALSEKTGRDLPVFAVMVPAFQETMTIAETMRRIASVNYPTALLELVVITYSDESPDEVGETTFSVANRTAAEIGTRIPEFRITVENVPAGFDGFFPGSFDTDERHVGKARGLNFALRRLHERLAEEEHAVLSARPGKTDENSLDFAGSDLPDFLKAHLTKLFDLPSNERTARFNQSRKAIKAAQPHLFERVQSAKDDATAVASSQAVGPRWVAVYDADADAPRDLFKYLAARIMEDPDVMGFQGPVAPLANFDEVHPLCGMAALWIAFSHMTSFPRLMTRPNWARPLAGTNWCMRIEGYESGRRLLGTPRNSTSRRHRFLHFDPRQLTEDLEAALRFYSEWRVAAEWHPYLEWEQGAPRPGDLVGQWTRWTLGTLQAIGGMIRSDLPFRQKFWMLSVPVEIAATGLGPTITVVLWVIILSTGFNIDPAFLPLTVFLTFINVLYAAPFILTVLRFRRLRQATLAGDAKRRQAMGKEMSSLMDDPRFSVALHGESTAKSTSRLDIVPGEVREELPEQGNGAVRSDLGDIVRVFLWAFPFLLFQLIPYYQGLTRWIFGRDRSWAKTARTRKA